MKYGLSATINIGNYQSIRPEFNCEAEGENFDEVRAKVMEAMKAEVEAIKMAFPKATFTLALE